jgi:hypothetical protein
VEYLHTVYEKDVIDEMIFHSSSMTKADMLAVLESYHASIRRLLLKGFRVLTPMAQYGVSIKGNFVDQSDGFDTSRHRLEPRVSPSRELRQAIMNQVPVEKEMATVQQPSLIQYLSLSNGHTGNTLIPGGMGKLLGKELRYDPDDPEQGLFLIAADKSEQRLSSDGIIMPGSLVFMIPAELAPGNYRLEVRVRVDEETLSSGRLKDVLTVAP